jgi:gliding motility-associated lipoprotein GldH
MRQALLIAGLVLLLSSCNKNSVYQEYNDFEKRHWLSSEPASFSFEIRDTLTTYDIYCNVRNSTHYPFSRLFVNFSLSDTTGNPLETKLLTAMLFEPKTGRPFGKTGLGDLYDHKIAAMRGFRFSSAGVYRVDLNQMMRTDTLKGVLSVGLSIERTQQP